VFDLRVYKLLQTFFLCNSPFTILTTHALSGPRPLESPAMTNVWAFLGKFSTRAIFSFCDKKSVPLKSMATMTKKNVEDR